MVVGSEFSIKQVSNQNMYRAHAHCVTEVGVIAPHMCPNLPCSVLVEATTVV